MELQKIGRDFGEQRESGRDIGCKGIPRNLKCYVMKVEIFWAYDDAIYLQINFNAHFGVEHAVFIEGKLPLLDLG